VSLSALALECCELMNRPPPPIEGTGIVLQTDEDIAKWIAERKSKWPSAKRLAERVRLLSQPHSLLLISECREGSSNSKRGESR
jgi:hypothetical protein